MNQPWKIILVLVGIFAAGSVTGGFLTLRFCREKMPANRPVPDQWAPKHLKRLTDRLALTAEQEEQIRPIVRRNMEQLNRLRNYSMAETKSVFESMEREITEKLTPEQRIKFEQMNREWQERQEREAKERAEKAKADRDKGKDGPRSDGSRPPPRDGPPPEKPPGD